MRAQFTVIIPTYERNDLLQEAIASVLRQSCADWELIVVDDASPTPALVPTDPRIRLVRLDENSGAANARNVGAASATGDVLCFCDDDDLFADDRLERIRPRLGDAPITVCWTRFIDGPATPGRVLDGDVADTILDSTTPSLGAVAVRRADFIPFDPRYEGLEDVEWWQRATTSLPVTTVQHFGYLCRRHDGPRHNNGLPIRIERNLAFLEAQHAWFARHRTAKAYRLRRVGLMSSALGDLPSARRAFARSWRTVPSPRSTAHLLRSYRSRA